MLEFDVPKANSGGDVTIQVRKIRVFEGDSTTTIAPATESLGPSMLNETLWQNWLDRGQLREREQSRIALAIVTWGSILAIVIIACVWTLLEPYGRFAGWPPFLGAAGLLIHTANRGRYVLAALFVGVSLFYNPVFPMIRFDEGSSLRAVVALSAIPFGFMLIQYGKGFRHA